MPPRPARAEIMDDPRTDPREISRAFRFIRWTNRRLRGQEGLMAHLDDWRDRLRPSLSMLDVGTGCGDIPLAALRWGDHHGIAFRVTGVDWLEASIADARQHVGKESRIELIQADAFALADRFEPRSFDVVHAGMFLHHFQDDQIIQLLRIMAGLGSRLLVWNDLSRDAASRFAVRLLTLPLSRVVRHDAVLSVDKGFKPEEAVALIRRAGLPDPIVKRWSWAGRFSIGVPLTS